MAQRIVLTCDIDDDGTEAEETVKFGLDGRDYEIDVCSRHHRELNDALRSFVTKGRKAEGPRSRRRNPRSEGAAGEPASSAPARPARSRPPARRPGAAGRGQGAQTVREWARANGMTVSDRGRISAEIADLYAAAHR